MKNRILLPVLFVFLCSFQAFGLGNLLVDPGFVPPTSIMPGNEDEVMKFEFQNQGGTSEAIEKIILNGMSGNVQDLDLVQIFNGGMLEASGNAFTGNMFMGNLEFMLATPISVAPAGNAFFSVNIIVAPMPIGTDIQLEIPPFNFLLAGGNTTVGDTINSGLISFSGNMGGNDLVISDNVSFSPPVNISPGSLNVEVFNYTIVNNSTNTQFIDGLNINVNQGTVNDIDQVAIYENGGLLVSGNSFSGNYVGGNINFSFISPIMLTNGANNSYKIKLDIVGAPSMSILDLNINPGDYTIAGGNSITGDPLNTGAMNLTTPGSSNLELQENPGFMAPTSMNQGDMDIVVLEFKLLGGSNIEFIDHIEFNVGGNVEDITALEIYDVSNSFALVASANMTDADTDGLLDYLDPDSMNAGVNVPNGNVFFRDLVIYESLPASSNVLELKISLSANAVSDNLEFSLDPSSIFTVGDNLVSGNFVTSGPIPVMAGNGMGLDIVLELAPSFTPPSNLMADDNILAMKFKFNNADLPQTIEEILIEIPQGNALTDLTSVTLYKNNTNFMGTITPVSHDNVVFTGLNENLSGGNTSFSVNILVASSPVSPGIEFTVGDYGVKLAGGNMVTGSATTGYIPFGAGNMMGGGNVILVGTAFVPPTDVAVSSVNVALMKFELDTTTNAVSSTLTDVEFFVKAGDAMNDFISFELYDELGMSPVSSTANIIGGNVVFETMSFGLSGGGNAVLSLRGSTGGSFVSDNIEFELVPEGVVLSIDSVSGNPQNSGPIGLGGGNMMGGSGNLEMLTTLFVPPSSLSPNEEAQVLEFLVENTGVVGEQLDVLEVFLPQGNAFADLGGPTKLIDLYTGNVLSNGSATTSENIDLTGIALFIPGSSNVLLGVNVQISATPESGNIEFEVHSDSLGFSSGNTIQTPINVNSGVISLGGGNMMGGSGNLNFMPSVNFFPPSSINFNESAQVLEFLVENSGSINEQLLSLDMLLLQGNAISDFALAPEVIDLYTDSILSTGSASSSDNVNFTGINVIVPAFGNVLLGVNVHISSMPESGSMEFRIESDSLVFSSGNSIDMYNFTQSGTINLGGNAMGGSGNFSSVAIGMSHALFVKQGELFSVGMNDFSALGNVGSTAESFPIKIGVKTDWLEVGVSSTHSVAVDQAGNVYGWGTNNYDKLGALANPTGTPAQITFGSTASEVIAGESTTFVMDDVNNVHAIGRNQLGQLGVGTANPTESAFVQLSALGEVDVFSVGVDHGLAIVSGNLWAWGSNGFGQLGTTSVSTYTSTPVLVDDMHVWIDVEAGGFHSFGITNTNQVFAWGKNTKGQLCSSGISTSIVDVPTEVISLPGTIAEISAGFEHTMMLFTDGNVYIGGSNDEGQGTANSMNYLDQFFDFSGAESVEAGPYNSAAVFGSNVQMFGRAFDGSLLSVPTVIAE